MSTAWLVRKHHDAVAHIAVFGGTDIAWRSRCSSLWEGTAWLEPGARDLVTRPSWNGKGGRPVNLVWWDELPVRTRLCTRCVARVRDEAAKVEAAVAARG